MATQVDEHQLDIVSQGAQARPQVTVVEARPAMQDEQAGSGAELAGHDGQPGTLDVDVQGECH